MSTSYCFFTRNCTSRNYSASPSYLHGGRSGSVAFAVASCGHDTVSSVSCEPWACSFSSDRELAERCVDGLASALEGDESTGFWCHPLLGAGRTFYRASLTLDLLQHQQSDRLLRCAISLMLFYYRITVCTMQHHASGYYSAG